MSGIKPIDATRLEDLKQLYAEAIAVSPLPWTRKADEFDDWGMIRGTKTAENPLGNMPIASTVNEAHFGDWRDGMYAKTKGRILEGEESAAYGAEWGAGPPQAIALAEAIVQIMNAFPELCESAGRKLKPLEWQSIADDNRFWYAETELGCYYTEPKQQRFIWYLSIGDEGGTSHVVCDSIEHGKEQCEADYRARIASLFE